MVEPIAIVTDSTSDLPAELAQKHAINVVPNVMVIDGQELEDGIGFTRNEFYQRLPEMNPPPTTATSSSGTYTSLYKRLFEQGYKQIISIHASSILSGIYNAAYTAAQAFQQHVRVIDSQQLSLGLGFQVLEIARQIEKGLQLQTILDYLPTFQQRVHVVAMLDTLEYVHRSGRVSWAKARMGSLLQIKPFIELKNGTVHSIGNSRTRHKGMEHLRELLWDLGPLDNLAILHSNAETEARKFLEFTRITKTADVLLVNITTIIGVHVGPNGLGFAAVQQAK